MIVDPTPSLTASESELRVGSRVWLKEKDLYGFVRYSLCVCVCVCGGGVYTVYMYISSLLGQYWCGHW